MVIDRQQASLNPDAVRDISREPLDLAAEETLALRVFVDRSVIEVYANDRVCFATRVYPTRADSLGVSLFARGNGASATVDAWDMAPIWPEETSS
jgi:beta-fructofuranosidase